MHRTHYATDDPLEAREFLDRAFGTRLNIAGSNDSRRQLTLDQVQAGQITVSEMSLPLDLTFQTIGDSDFVFATMLDGITEFDDGHGISRYAHGDVYLSIHPQSDYRQRADHTRGRTLSLPASLLDETARQGAEQSARDWTFSSLRPITGGAQRWRQTVKAVENLVTGLDGDASPLLIGPAARLLAATALTVFPNTAIVAATEHPGHDGRDAHSTTLRRAVAFIEASADIDIGIADIARAAYATPRAVQMAFRRHLDTTPTAYLRQVRLQHAHQQLRDASPDDAVTVARVAIDWGFASPGRFAAYYRDTFGQSPSETLNS